MKINLYMTFILCFLFNSVYGEWVDVTIISDTEVDHFCDVVPAPNGLTHDVYCAGLNPEVLPDHGISATGINISGQTNATNLTGTNMDISSAVSTAALYVNGNPISAGSGSSLTVSNPSDCDNGEALVWVASVTTFLCPDSDPTFAGFTNVTDVSVSIDVSSNIVQVQDINYPVEVSVMGDGMPQLRTCSDAACNSPITDWQNYPSTIMHDEYLQLRMNSSAGGSSTNSATIFIGDYSDEWTVTTEFVPPVVLTEDFDDGLIDTSFITGISNLNLSLTAPYSPPYSLRGMALDFLPVLGDIQLEIGSSHSGGTLEAAYLSIITANIIDADTGVILATYPGSENWQTFSLTIPSGVSTIAIEVAGYLTPYGIDSITFTPD